VQIPIPSETSVLAFVLVLCRIGALMMIAPMLSSRSVPMRVKAIFAIVVSLIVMPMIDQPDNLASMEVGAIVVAMVKEILIGFAIGFAAAVVVFAWQIGGAILDLMTGFSFGGVVDPIYGNQSSLLQQLYAMLAGMIFVSVGGEQWLLAAIARSFEKFPIGNSVPYEDFAQLALTVVTTSFVVGLGVIAPIFIALLLTDIAFGLVARAAPQTQILQVEFPIKIVVGVSMLIVSLPLMVPLFVRTLNRMLGIAVGGG